MERTEPGTADPLVLEGAPISLPEGSATATFGMGCFWGPDARFGALEGVARTRVGYAGGTDSDPSYFSLGDHTEVVQIDYDPEVVSYEDLLEVFWDTHDWASTAPKRQYRSVVLAHDDDQYATAQRERTALEDRAGRSAAVDIERLETFHLAEPSHQKYELRSRPIVGGLFIAMFAQIVAVGLAIPAYMGNFEQAAEFRAVMADVAVLGPVLGERVIADTIFVIGSTGMAVGGLAALVLDNTIPGTPKERGLAEWDRITEDESEFDSFWDGWLERRE